MNLAQSLPKTERYLFIDGLRAIAMILVMMDHSYDFYWRYVPNYAHITISPIYAFFSGCGKEGLFIYFMISGFLITGVMIPDFSNGIDLKKFYISRFFRIVPLFSIVVLCVYIISKILGSRYFYSNYSDISYLVSLFYLQDFFQEHPIFHHVWSLALEVQFYIFYPLIAIALFKFTGDESKRRWVFLKIFFVLAILSILYRHFYQKMGLHELQTLEYCDGIFYGSILKILEPYYPKFKQPYRLVFTIVCLLTASIVLKLSTIMADRKLALIGWDPPFVTYVVFTLVFFSAYYKLKPLNFILENRIIRWFGRISYAFFLWHYPLRYFLVQIGPTPYYGFFSSLSCLWITTTIAAIVSTYTIEKFFLNLKLKILDRGAPRPKLGINMVSTMIQGSN